MRNFAAKVSLGLVYLLLLGCSAAEKLISQAIPEIDVPVTNALMEANAIPSENRLLGVDGFVFVPIRSRQGSTLEARVLDDPDDAPSGYRPAAGAEVSIVSGGTGSAITNEQGYFFIPFVASRQGGTTVRLRITFQGQTYEAEHSTSYAFTIPPTQTDLLKATIDENNPRFKEALDQGVTKLERFKFHLLVFNRSTTQSATVRLAVSRNPAHTSWEGVLADTTDSKVIFDRTIPPDSLTVVHEFYSPSQNADIFNFVRTLVYGERRMIVYFQSNLPGELEIRNVFVEAKFGVEL